ncbi:MAG: hypothetical protein IPL53_25420 [Ignavibacteria bacterium]|nr:hypothetical protein [Ignavibacteria bacterium]
MSLFKRVLKYVKPYTKELILANVFTILVVIFSLLSVLMLFPFIDLLFNDAPKIAPDKAITSIFDLKDIVTVYFAKVLIQYEKMDVLKYMCLLILLTFFLKNLFTYLQTYFM